MNEEKGKTTTIRYDEYENLFTTEEIKKFLERLVSDVLSRRAVLRYTVSGKWDVMHISLPTHDLDVKMVKATDGTSSSRHIGQVSMILNRISENCMPVEYTDTKLNSFMVLVYRELIRYYWDAYLPTIDTQIKSYSRSYNPEWNSYTDEEGVHVSSYSEFRTDKQVMNDIIYNYMNCSHNLDSKFRGIIDAHFSLSAIETKIKDANRRLYDAEKACNIPALESAKRKLELENEKISISISSGKNTINELTTAIVKLTNRKKQLEEDIAELEDKRMRLRLETEELKDEPTFKTSDINGDIKSKRKGKSKKIKE